MLSVATIRLVGRTGVHFHLPKIMFAPLAGKDKRAKERGERGEIKGGVEETMRRRRKESI